ncbi:aliphatic nitrilase [Natronocella acetinitrilica]|uniref:Aliphatic nitrilase n=2 Tax=Natronocella acetinitrilica TaxID=414046 RepID=A0AAE3G388_9GAMM|nr:aliphatic nitrilase [Natronocella acetinitrilica]
MGGTPVKVALAQVSPRFLDTPATLDKACSHIAEAAQNGADIIAFPETYLSAFPIWCAFAAPIRNHDYFCRFAASSVLLDGPELRKLAEAARAAGIWVSMGFNERSAASVGCIWNSNVIFNRKGELVNHRRKLVPTFFEKLVWANGDGAGLEVVDGDIGRVGMLICGENTNPLARYALMSQGEQLHLSSYPPVWPTRDPSEPTNYDLAEAIRIRSAAVAFEGKCFNAVVAGVVDSTTRAAIADGIPGGGELLDACDQGISLVIGPRGTTMASSTPGDETLLYCDIDLGECVEPKQFHDLVGGYNRFDIFQFHVDRRPRPPATFTDAAGSPLAQRQVITVAGDSQSGATHDDSQSGEERRD